MPIPFTCPHCGKTTNIAEQFIGQTGPCGHCGKMVTVEPPAGGPARSAGGGGASAAIIVLAILGLAFLCGPLLLGGAAYFLWFRISPQPATYTQPVPAVVPSASPTIPVPEPSEAPKLDDPADFPEQPDQPPDGP